MKMLKEHPRPEEELKRLSDRAKERFSANVIVGQFYEMVRKAYTID